MKSIGVYCGANAGDNPLFTQKAQELGAMLAKESITLVYGGGKVGLMGVIADAVLENGGEVIGVIPHFLSHKEIEHTGVTQMHYTETMHERKMKMYDLAEAFIAMPGGFGTLDEVFEMATWSQLGLHQRPIGFLNTAGFYDSLLSFLDHAVETDFLKQANRDLLVDSADPADLMEKLRNYQATYVPKWINEGER